MILRIRQNPNRVETVKYNAFSVCFRGFDEQALREVLIDKEYEFLGNKLKNISSPRILDIGAHIGTFALWAFDKNRHSRIMSVEATPHTYDILEKNAAHCKAQNLDWGILNKAASDLDNRTLRLADFSSTMSNRISDDGTIDVETVSLSTLVNRMCPDGGNIDILKIDIEGAEEDFLCNTPSLLSRVNNLVVELHPGLCNAERVRSLLKEAFVSVREINGRTSSKPLLYCSQDNDG